MILYRNQDVEIQIYIKSKYTEKYEQFPIHFIFLSKTRALLLRRSKGGASRRGRPDLDHFSSKIYASDDRLTIFLYKKGPNGDSQRYLNQLYLDSHINIQEAVCSSRLEVNARKHYCIGSISKLIEKVANQRKTEIFQCH